jgi:Flp pilus assembly protein TadB
MKVFLFLVAFAISGVASAQQGKQRQEGKQQMRHEDRQRLREDMNQVYRDRGARPERPQRPMSPQEREKLRQDVRDADKQLKR